jgi:hypothetical protein
MLFSKRDPVAWRVRIPSGQGLARHANAGGGGAWPTSGQKRSRILSQASPCQTLGAMHRKSFTGPFFQEDLLLYLGVRRRAPFATVTVLLMRHKAQGLAPFERGRISSEAK